MCSMARTKQKPKVFILQDGNGFHVVLHGRSPRKEESQGKTRQVSENKIDPRDQGPWVQDYQRTAQTACSNKLICRLLDKEAPSKYIELIQNYFKTGTLHVSERNVLGVLKLAGKLRLTIVYDACLLLLSKALRIGNWAVIWHIASKGCCHTLKNIMTQFADRHLSQCFTRKDAISLSGSLTHNKVDSQSLAYLVLHCQIGFKRNKKHRKSLTRMMYDILNMEATLWKECFKDYFQSIDKIDIHELKCSTHVLKETINTFQQGNERTMLTNSSRKALLKKTNEIPQSITRSMNYTGILVSGGVHNATHPEPIDWVFLYKPDKGTWSRLVSMMYARYNHTLVYLDGIIYAIGGNKKQSPDTTTDWLNPTQINSVEKFSLKLNEWTEGTSMILPREEHCSVAIAKHLYSIGGHDGVSPLCSVERYSPSTDQWRLEIPMPQLHTGATVVTDGQYIFIIGGFDGIKWLNTMECYDTLTKAWRLSHYPFMATQRGYAGAEILLDDIFVFGGTNGHESLASCEVFNIRNKQWRIGPPLNEARLNAAHCQFEGNILVMGGESNGQFLNTVEQLDIQNWSWRILCQMPISAAGLRSTPVIA